MDASRFSRNTLNILCLQTSMTFLMALPVAVVAQTTVDEVTRQNLSGVYSVNALLINGDAIRFGFWDFNVSDYVDLELEGFGDAESARTRQSLSVASFPYDWEFPVRDTDDRLLLGVGLSYLTQDQDLTLVVDDSEQRADRVQDTVLTLSGRAAWRHQVNEDVTMTLGSGLHWMRYRNDTDFRSEASRELRSSLDGISANIEVDALMAEPAIGLSYQRVIRSVDWHFFTDYHYLFGQTLDPDRDAHDASPESWYWTNGVRMLNPVFSRALPGQNIWVRFARVDVGGDIGDLMGNDHYYEAGIAWLVDTGDHIPFVDNIAIGINFNVGSVLRGGSLYLTFNED